MDNKKRMMFILEEDYYFVTIRIIAILVGLECYKKPLLDYRKIGLIFEFIKSAENMRFLEESMNLDELDIFQREKLLTLFCNAKTNIIIIKRVLFFLEKKGYVKFLTNKKVPSIDILLEASKLNDIEVIIKEIQTEIETVKRFKHHYKSVKHIKYDSLLIKIFGEVKKWES